DLGFYYDALDYTVAEMILNGGKVTVQPGTAIGMRVDYVPDSGQWTLAGFEAWEGATIISRGTPNAPITFVGNPLVQESWSGLAPVVSFLPWYDPNIQDLSPPTLDFRFSNFYLTPDS